MWKEDVNLDVFKFSEHQISTKVTKGDGFQWILIGFYGWPETKEWYKSWALLSYICTLVDGPWMCIKDFNEILSTIEKLSVRPTPSCQLDAFREALELYNLVNLGFIDY